MQYHLSDFRISLLQASMCAVLVVDKVAWHLTGKLEVPENISIVPLPPYSELNPVEQVWQQRRHRAWQIDVLKIMSILLKLAVKRGNNCYAPVLSAQSQCARNATPY
ncbi:MAG: hypothetical protein H0A75_01010 [Candidatus Methanofishera endochildressiae]|uniref:Tc1-like transposase DDE domain-containing protein n=1 Tax=Candidatus Methanofishera endochildressiae TaxID=2738884 RepID=A0A7Z0MN34_9GAMM|nr:hypothetical protein [Candidatus Methanofishera endochildressiae]